MEKNLYIFESEKFGKIRAVDAGLKVYFVGSDVTRALGHENGRQVLDHLARGQDRLVVHSSVFKMTGRLGGEMRPFVLPAGMKHGPVGLINEASVHALVNASSLKDKRGFKLFIDNIAREMFNRDREVKEPSFFSKEEMEAIQEVSLPGKEVVKPGEGQLSSNPLQLSGEDATPAKPDVTSSQGITVETFKNEEFGEVRVIKVDGQPMFVANDVAAALGYKRPSDAIVDHCKSGDSLNWRTAYVPHSNGFGGTNVTVVGEANLYRLIMHSTLPNAEKFQDWVCEEVLPSIRKHGAYLTEKKVEEALLDPDVLIQLATTIKEERQKRIEIEAKAVELQKENEEMKPESLFARAVKASKDTILVGDLARFLKQNGVDMGQNRLFEWLRRRDYLGSRGSYRNKPTQRAIDLGIFQVEEKTFKQKNGYSMLTITTRVTGKGQVYLLNKILEGEEERESSDEEGKQTWRLA